MKKIKLGEGGKIVLAIIALVIFGVFLLTLVDFIRSQWWILLSFYLIFTCIFYFLYIIYKQQLLIVGILFFSILGTFLTLDLLFFKDTYSGEYCIKSTLRYTHQLHHFRLYITNENGKSQSFNIRNSDAQILGPGIGIRTGERRCYNHVNLTYGRISKYIFHIEKQ